MFCTSIGCGLTQAVVGTGVASRSAGRGDSFFVVFDSATDAVDAAAAAQQLSVCKIGRTAWTSRCGWGVHIFDQVSTYCRVIRTGTLAVGARRFDLTRTPAVVAVQFGHDRNHHS